MKEFNDKELQIIFSDVDLTVKLHLKHRKKNLSTLGYDSEDYPDVKDLLQKFLNETDLTKKMEYFADAMNIGSLAQPLRELVFVLNILWKYDWKSESCNKREKEKEQC